MRLVAGLFLTAFFLLPFFPVSLHASISVANGASDFVQVDYMEIWQDFKRRFVTEEGRVVDFMQHGISHSEGQGYVMLLAVRMNDRPLFEKVWNWTRRNLMVRGADALFAWSWGRRVTGESTVIDYNNASDGDLAICWALMSAARKWNRPDYAEQAARIA